MNKFPFEPINTGQQFPVGIRLHDGQCQQCGRKGKMAKVRCELTLNVFIVNETDDGFDQAPPVTELPHVCAECLADFLVVPAGKIYAENSTGRFQLLAAEPRR